MSFASQARMANNSRVPNATFIRDIARPGNKDPTRQCIVCGWTEHEASGCFTVIGYPDWWEDNRSKNRNNNRKTNNTSNNAAAQDRTIMPKANKANVTTPKIQAKITISEEDRQGLSGITDDQWYIVQKLINKGKTTESLKSKTDYCVWILDAGATHHMSGRLELMDNTRDIAHIPILLPAGSEAMASKQGTVKLTPKLYIHNVYYVNGFHTNLISFGQLVTDNLSFKLFNHKPQKL